MGELLKMLVIVVHLTGAASWWGSMAYSLIMVQPKVDAFFPDEERREEFLIRLAHGNRWPVVGLIALLIATGLVVALTSGGWLIIGYGFSVVLYSIASVLFWYVSWRHWPARVFARTAELAGFRRRLRVLAAAILLLVGTAFITALSVSVMGK